MNRREMSRRAFVVASGAIPTAIALPLWSSARTAQGSAAGHGMVSTPYITPMLYGTPREETDLEAWFASMKKWGVQQWMSSVVPYRPHYGKAGARSDGGVAFLEDVLPGIRPYLESQTLATQEASIRKVADLCAKNDLEFWLLIPFPLLPSQNLALVEKNAPYLFNSGRLNLYEPRVADLLKAEIRQFKKALPMLKGINVWLAEGAGATADITAEDLQRNTEWEGPLIRAFDDVTREVGIRGILFAHEYLQTVRSHRAVYEMMAGTPELIIMDDITWPEEDMLHPFLGYLPQQDRELLFQTNPVALNFLLDTEYIGEGVLPSVYPRWWKHNVREAVRSGAAIAMGRTFFWDGGYSDVNFNRLNAYMFVRFCYNPEADPRQVFNEAAQEMFGKQIPERLLDILWETEPIIKDVIGVNGVDSLDHSRFPQPIYIDIVYTPQSNAMKAIDDLFLPPGTPLYPPLTDSLNNYKQWRWQNKTVSEPAEAYLGTKKNAVAWAERILPEVRRLSDGLEPRHRELFVHGYDLVGVLAKGMELFVETADVHYQWAHAKKVNDAVARIKFRALATRFRAQAKTVPDNPFLYKERMVAFAEFLENDLPRIK